MGKKCRALVGFCPYISNNFALYILGHNYLSPKGSSQYVFIVICTIYQNKIASFLLLVLLLLNFTWANIIIVTPTLFLLALS